MKNNGRGLHFFYLISISFVLLMITPFTACAQGKTSVQRPNSVTNVSYYREIQPIFRTACSGCHNSESAAGGLNLTSFAASLKGGKGGALFVAGKGADSKLVKYLTGALKPQMPPGGALKSSDIDKFRRWVDEGGKSDDPIVAKPNVKSLPLSSLKLPIAPGISADRVKTGKAFILQRAAPVTALAFSPDGKILAVGTYREVQFWNPDARKMISSWKGHADALRSLSYSKDGKFLAAAGGVSGGTGEVRIWDVVAEKEVQVLSEHLDSVNGVAFSPDGTKIATASADKTIKIWDLKTGKSIFTGRDHSDSVLGVSWSPDGKTIASCSSDKSVKIWDAATLKRLYSLGGHDDVVTSIQFNPDGKSLISASSDKSARLWNLGPDGGNQTATLSGHPQGVLGVAYSSNGQLLATCSADKTVKLWLPNGSLVRTLSEEKDWVYSVRFSPDGKLVVAGAWDGSVMIWSVSDGKIIGSFFTYNVKK